MAEIYSIPDSSASTPQFTIPIGGMAGGGLFGNGNNTIGELVGLAVKNEGWQTMSALIFYNNPLSFDGFLLSLRKINITAYEICNCHN